MEDRDRRLRCLGVAASPRRNAAESEWKDLDGLRRTHVEQAPLAALHQPPFLSHFYLFTSSPLLFIVDIFSDESSLENLESPWPVFGRVRPGKEGSEADDRSHVVGTWSVDYGLGLDLSRRPCYIRSGFRRGSGPNADSTWRLAGRTALDVLIRLDILKVSSR